jgi:hypothetical protein
MFDILSGKKMRKRRGQKVEIQKYRNFWATKKCAPQTYRYIIFEINIKCCQEIFIFISNHRI